MTAKIISITAKPPPARKASARVPPLLFLCLKSLAAGLAAVALCAVLGQGLIFLIRWTIS